MDRPGSMRIEQSATDEAYLLDIRLSGVKPTEVKIEARGPWILVTRDTSAQASEEETFSDGRGYRRSFSYSSGRANRRFNVPRDGDTTAMQRQDTEDAIRIAIPRTRPPAGSR
jgi:HSP20 family molecular chaperone IbpA